MALGLGQIPSFYNPASQYGAKNDWATTPLVTNYLDPQIPQGVYTNYLANQGFGGQDRRSQWARGMYGQTQSGYQAALRENPALSYASYLQKQFGPTGLQNMWAGLAPQQRGENPNSTVGATRMIGWG